MLLQPFAQWVKPKKSNSNFGVKQKPQVEVRGNKGKGGNKGDDHSAIHCMSVKVNSETEEASLFMPPPSPC